LSRPDPHATSVLLLFAVLAPLFLGRLADLPLPKWDDLTHAAMGKEILATGDWFTMHANGEPIWIKPPLYFWLEAAWFRLFGATEYGARLPSALCGYLTAILVYLLARRLFGRRTAFLAILVTATSFFFLKYSRRAMIDVPVAFATTLGAWALVRAQRRERWYLLFGVALALGYYFKAVQGLYLLAIAPLYLLAAGQARRLAIPWFIAANLGAAGLVALWALPQYRANGAAFLSSQSALGPLLSRGLSDEPARPLAPVVALFEVCWPWIPLSAWGLVALARRRPWSRGAALLLVWFLVVIVELCLSRSFFRRYLVPVVPVLVISAAWAAARLLPRRWFSLLHRRAWVGAGAVVILLQCLPIPLDNRGTDQIEVFRTIRHLTAPADRIVLYKGNHWTVGQGLSFYADRRLAAHYEETARLAADLEASRAPLVGIAAAADYEELKGALGRALVERARPDGFVIFLARPGR
jgi:4-amino-4-deoxy-L-arabinose transferase-like glycosyltransferase